MMKFDTISAQEIKTTSKLLAEIRKDFGLDLYLLLKKMFIAVAIANDWEEKLCIYHCKGEVYYSYKHWKSYQDFLFRNMEIYRKVPYECNKSNKEDMIDFFKRRNYLNNLDELFFGVKGYTILSGTLLDVEKEATAYWQERYNNAKLDKCYSNRYV